ncbi:Chlorovirus glycoprotein repeat domain-containing protein [Paramecium bursaria Chlorella virus CVM-1]|nr:Chlorovirus glycoprotein repeat domain-containing protein [Paramecium bursaria Chlorella virus CVM-1]
MDGNITTGAYINAGFFVGDGSGLTGITSTPAAISTTDVRGNIIGSYANVSNIISNVGGNIGNVVFLGGNGRSQWADQRPWQRGIVLHDWRQQGEHHRVICQCL